MVDRLNPGDEGSARKVDHLISTVLAGRYEIMAKVGSGGWGAVYRGKNIALGNPVAIKILEIARSANLDMVRRFYQEAKSASKLQHSGIVRVFDYAVEPFPYIVMEYMDGDSLGSLIESQGPLPWKDAIGIFLQLCDALAYAHKQGIIHRDIKPTNVMVRLRPDGTYEAKLLDFGLAKMLLPDGEEGLRLTTTGQTLGSPPYMSPEQCRGEPLDGRTDLYSLGCLMFEVLTGRLTFDGDGLLDVLRKHITEIPPQLMIANPRISLPGDLERVVARCLAKSPGERYPSMSELQADLELILNGKRTRRRFSFRLPHFRSIVFSKRLKIALGSGLALTALALLAFHRPILAATYNFCYTAGLNQLKHRELVPAELAFSLSSKLADSLGPPDRRKLRALSGLASVYVEEQKWLAASAVNKQLSELKQEHPSPSLQVLSDQGEQLLQQNNYAGAESLFKKALSEAEVSQSAGGENLIAARYLSELARIKMHEAKLDEAETLARQSLNLREKLLEVGDAPLSQSFAQLGAILAAKRQFAQAEPFLRRSLASRESTANEDQLDLADTLSQLAAVNYNLKNYKQCQSYCYASWSVLCRYYRPKDPMHFHTYFIMSIFLAQSNRTSDILELFRQVHGQSVPSTQVDDQLSAAFYNDGMTAYNHGVYSESVDLLKRALKLRLATSKPDNNQSVSMVSAYANALSKTGKEKEAASLREHPEKIADFI